MEQKPLTHVLTYLLTTHLGLDEAALEVAVDDAGGLGREGAIVQRPAAHLVRVGVRVRVRVRLRLRVRVRVRVTLYSVQQRTSFSPAVK